MATKKKENAKTAKSKNAKLNIEEMLISDLVGKKAEYNPRKISTEQKNGLRKSMEAFGYVQNIVFNKRTGRVVSGHQRLDLLAEEGYEKVDVHTVDLSEENEKKLNILMNSDKITGDFTAGINEILNDIFDSDPELFDLTNMSLLFVDEPSEDEEEAPEEENKDEIPGMKLLPYESYDAIIVVFKRRDDFMFASSVFGLDKRRSISSPNVVNKKLGYTRCVDGETLVNAIKKEEEGFQL